MSRYPSYFGSSTITVNKINDSTKIQNFTIEDLNTAIIDDDEKKVIEVLNTNSISINQTISRDPYRNTLLHTAITMGNVNIIQTLINMGADLRIKNKKGESCADLLSKSHLGSIIQYLADTNVSKVQELKRDVAEKDSRIKSLQENITILEDTNKKIFKEKQEIEGEAVKLRKRNRDLEESNSVLRQATKKSKN